MVAGREPRSKHLTHIIAVEEEAEVPTCMMENSADDEQESMITKPLLDDHDGFSGKGGFRTMPFVLANEAFAQVASYGLQPSMILYLTREYHLNMATGSNIIFLWSAATNFMPLLGATVADSFLGRFRMILFGCVISLLDSRLLDLEELRLHPWLLVLISYKKQVATTMDGFWSPISAVAVASYRKRHIELSTESSKLVCHHHRVPSICLPSEKLRFLNKACIILDPEKDLTTDGTAADPWSLCTVNQVEDLKSILKVIPLWSTGMIMSVNNSQLSFSVLQAKFMNRKFGPNFEMPAGSCSMFAVVGAVLWIPFYLQISLPVASRILGRPVHLSTRKRMGIGIALSFVGMIVAATVEVKRRSLAIREGYSDDSDAVVDMSLLWLLPQSFLTGAGATANIVAQNEFYYSEFPRSMSSISSTLSLLGMSAANLVASFLMNAIDELSKLGGKESWISTNINKGHYDYYYWVLAGLSVPNMIYFLICSKAYGPGKEDKEETTFHEQDD